MVTIGSSKPPVKKSQTTYVQAPEYTDEAIISKKRPNYDKPARKKKNAYEDK